MSLRLASLRAYFALIRSWMSSASKGGRWALSHPVEVQRNLRYFWLDGLFANASDSIILTYLTLFLLALGATGAQIGLLSSLSSLSATLLLLPGAWLVERFNNRKVITVISSGILARGMLLFIVLTPLLFPKDWMVIAAMFFAVMRDGFGNLGLPSWVSLTGDLVPIGWRGRYLASRNIVMGIAGMGTILIAGQVINRVGGITGYQVALGVAYALGMVSTFFFSRLVEPKRIYAAASTFNIKEIVNMLRTNHGFLMFALAAGVWNFSLNIAGPFFSVYMAKGLLLSPATIGTLGVFTSIAALPAQRLMGPLVDRLGPRRVQMISGFMIPVLPFAWIFITQAWHIAVMNMVSGILWAGFNLAAFSMLLTVAPPEQMARFSAIYQMIIAISLAGGAALGSLVISVWSFAGVFILSAIGRLVGAVLFSWLVPARDPIEAPVAS